MPNMGGGGGGITKSASPPVSPVAGELWSDTDNNQLYRRNDANDEWLTVMGEEAKKGITTYNETIGDYTTTDGVYMSTGTIPDVYSTDFSSSTGWTLQGNNTISSGKMNFQSTNGDNSIYDLGAAGINQAYFRIRWKFVINYDSCGCNGAWNFGITSAIPTSASSGNVYGYGISGHSHISAAIDIDLGQWKNQPMNQFAGGGGNADSSGAATSAGTYYMELEKDGTTLKITHYSDGTYSSASGTASVTVDAELSATLRYMTLASRHDNQSVNGSFDDLSYNNGTTSKATDDDTGTQAETTSAANQWIKADLGAEGNVSGVAIIKGSNNTETEFQIQTSSDDSTYTTKRTILTSALVTTGYKYVRMNLGPARYIRIYGSSGDSKIVSLQEIKILKQTDSFITTDHGHLNINATDTSVSLSGG